MEDDIQRYMNTPQDISKKTLEEQANHLTLHFIGFIVRPLGINGTVYKKCLKAFNENRGQYEWEFEAVLGVLEENSEEK